MSRPSASSSGRTGVPAPATQDRQDAHRHDRELAQDDRSQTVGEPTVRLARGSQGVQWGEPRGAERGHDRAGERDEQAQRKCHEQAERRQREAGHEDGARRREEPDDRPGEEHAPDDAEQAADRADRDRLAQDDAQDLPRGRAGRAQQAELPRPLPDGHRHGVADQERADRERHEAEQEGDAHERLLRGGQPRGGILRRLDDERLAEAGGDAVEGLVRVVAGQHEVDRADRRRNLERIVERSARRDEDVPAPERGETRVRQQADDPERRHSLPATSEQQLVPEPESVACRPRGGHQRVGRAVLRQRDTLGRRQVADLRVHRRIDAKDEQREDLLVFTGRRGHEKATLGDRRGDLDLGQRAQGLERARLESGIGEGPQPNVGRAEQVGGGALQRLARTTSR